MKNVKKSINVPIIIDNLLPHVDELHYPTIIAMKDTILKLSKEQWRKRKTKLFFKYLQDNEIDFLDEEKVIISLLKHRLTSEDLKEFKHQMVPHSSEDSGFAFLCRALDITDIEILIHSNHIERTTDDMDFSDFIREY